MVHWMIFFSKFKSNLNNFILALVSHKFKTFDQVREKNLTCRNRRIHLKIHKVQTMYIYRT